VILQGDKCKNSLKMWHLH